jgi:hypothetical protein
MLELAEQETVDVIDHLGIDVPRPVQERLTQQLGSRHALDLGQPVSFRDDRDELECAEVLESRCRIHRLEWRQDDRHIEFVRAHPIDEVRIETRVDLDLHVREPGLELA